MKFRVRYLEFTFQQEERSPFCEGLPSVPRQVNCPLYPLPLCKPAIGPLISEHSLVGSSASNGSALSEAWFSLDIFHPRACMCFPARRVAPGFLSAWSLLGESLSKDTFSENRLWQSAFLSSNSYKRNSLNALLGYVLTDQLKELQNFFKSVFLTSKEI